MLDVRLATSADLPRALDTLTAAFVDYPFIRHAIPEDNVQQRVRRFNELFLEEVGLPYGKVWLADDGDAVACWTTPETPFEALTALGSKLAEVHGDRAPQAMRAETALDPHRPKEPVWFLGAVGVHPDRRGHGLGAAVLCPGLEAAADTGAYLETSTSDNVRFYQRLGFDIAATVDLPDGGPLTWAMRKPPQDR